VKQRLFVGATDCVGVGKEKGQVTNVMKRGRDGSSSLCEIDHLRRRHVAETDRTWELFFILASAKVALCLFELEWFERNHCCCCCWWSGCCLSLMTRRQQALVSGKTTGSEQSFKFLTACSDKSLRTPSRICCFRRRHLKKRIPAITTPINTNR
jgi:hypothetical protein